MDIRKLEAYEEFENDYPEKVQHLIGKIEDRVDNVTADYIEQLAEACYKEGYKDGYRFSDWLHENTK